MKRPPTVLITQCFLIIFASFLLVTFLFNLVRLLGHLDQQFSVTRTVVGYSIILAFISLLVVAFWGLMRRANYGRWLAVVSLLILSALFIFMAVRPPSGPYQSYGYDNNAQRAGAVIAQFLLNVPLLVLALRLSLSKKIGEFFAK